MHVEGSVDPIRDIETIDTELLLSDLDAVQKQLTKIEKMAKTGDKESITVAQWSPAVDITEDEKEYLITAELPDVKREDVKVNVENGVMTLSGERRFEKEEKDKKYHRIERSYGSFVRSFTLPEGTSGDKVSADFKDGVLKVHLPKDEQKKPKNVEVKIQ